MSNSKLDDVSSTNRGETIEQKVFRYLRRCVDEYVVDLKSKKIICDLHMHELAGMIGLAIAEEREACKAACIAVREESIIPRASTDYIVGRQIGSHFCLKEIEKRGQQ